MNKRKPYLFAVLLCCCCWWANPLIAQPIALKNVFVRHIGEKEGLLYRTFDFIMQDSKGFIWVGENRALQRYDGKRFKTYFDGTEGTNMSYMTEDNDRILWLCTHAGLYWFNQQKDQFIKYQDSVMVRGKNEILMCTNIAVDYKGNLWFACYGYYAVKFANTNKVVCADSLLHIKKAPYLNYLSIQDKQKVWFAGVDDYAIGYYDVAQQKVFNHYYNPEKHSLLDQKFKQILRYCFDSTGGVWVNNGWDCGILYWAGNGKPIKKLKLKSLVDAPRADGENQYAPASKMVVTSKNEVYIQFEEHMGIARYNRTTESLEYLYASRNTDNGLWDNISPGFGNGEMFLDKDDNIWYPGDGLSVINPDKQIFSNIQGNGYDDWFSKSQNNFTGTSMISLVKLADSTYIASFDEDGLWHLGKDFGLKEKLNLCTGMSNSHSVVFATEANSIFIQNKGKLYRYNFKDKKCKEVLATGEPTFKIRKTFVENDHSVWYTHYNSSIGHFNPVTYQNLLYPVVEPTLKTSLAGLNSILPDGKVGFWIAASYVGLHLFDTTKKAITASYYLNAANINDLPSNVFGPLTRYNDDTLIIAGNALIFFDQNTHQFSKFKIADGLISDRISSTVVDAFNKELIWVNTYDKGVFIFNIKTKAVTNFSASTGNIMFRGEYFNYMNPATGSMLFSNVNGYCYVNRNGFINNSTDKKITIAEILVNNQPLNVDSVLANGKLSLSHSQNNVVIKLASLNYWELSNTSFFVRTSKKESWQKVDNNAEVSYLKLRPGEYAFEFALAENERVPIAASSYLSLLVTPPFYQTSWFIFLCVCAVFGLLYAWYRRRLKTINDEAAFKQKIAEAEVAALKAQMNPHFIFNSLNAINRFILKSEKIEASNYLSKFSKLIRNILENSKLQWISLENETETLQLYLELEAMRFQQKFSFSIEVEDSLEPSLVQIPSMLVQPFAENAIWHGLLPRKTNCQLIIKFALINEVLTCTIQDNGVGRSASAKTKISNLSNKTSIGVSDTEKRILLMQHNKASNDVLRIEDLMDAEGQPAGTVVTLKIPYNYL
jgi:streptogramin lyase